METQIKEELNVNLTPKVSNYDGKVLQSKVIKTIPDFEKFMAYYHKTNTVSVSLDYLVACYLVRVFFYNEDEWVAGYVINSSAPMRYFEVFSNYEKGLILRDKGLKENNMVEISTTWISLGLTRIDPNARIEVYMQSIKDAYETNKPIIIGGSKKMTVWQTFQKILAKEMYFGKIVFEGQTTEIGKIVYEHREQAMLNFQKYLLENSISIPLVAERGQSLSMS
jgi:hypothetical protein